MTTIKVDFSDVEQVDRSPIKAGKYDVVIEDVEVRTAEGKEHEYLNWTLSIADGEYEGRKLYMITSLSPKALWNLQAVLQSFGLEDDEVELEADDDTHQLLNPDLIGEAAVATVRNQLYNGSVQARVVALVGAEGEPEPKPKPKKKAKPADDGDGRGSKPKARPKAKDEDDEEEDDDEPEDAEEEEEEEKPKARRPLKAASPATKSKKPATKRRFR